jgi:hypothetical protein
VNDRWCGFLWFSVSLLDTPFLFLRVLHSLSCSFLFFLLLFSSFLLAAESKTLVTYMHPSNTSGLVISGDKVLKIIPKILYKLAKGLEMGIHLPYRPLTRRRTNLYTSTKVHVEIIALLWCIH